MIIKARILSIDQGTTGTTAMVWDERGLPLGRAAREHTQYYPQPGWVEHDAEEIWAATLDVAQKALQEAGTEPAEITAVGITNQRETVVFWERSTGKPLAKAIVWQCRRTAPLCDELKKAGREELFREKTGLVLDPYFSGTKIRWALEHIPAVGDAARRGELACGTIDSYLLFRLTGGRVHATDYSNASRTLLFNIHTLQWDPQLLEIRMFRQRFCRGSCPAAPFTARPTPMLSWACGCQWAAWPATSRPPFSARPASSRAW